MVSPGCGAGGPEGAARPGGPLSPWGRAVGPPRGGLVAAWGRTVGLPQQRREAAVSPLPGAAGRDVGSREGAVRLPRPCGARGRA